jgi:uncharacterized protein
MRIGTAEPDSTFLTQGQALAALLAKRGIAQPIEVLLSPSASIDNANRLHAGEIEFGYMAANWIGRAKRGEAPFKQPIDLSMVAPMNAGPLFFIVRADSTLRTFADLKGKRVCTGPASSGMTQHAHTIFAALGGSFADFTPVYLSFADGAEALARGEIDAQLQCPIPNKVMTAIDAKLPLRVLDYTPSQLDTMLSKVPFYRRTIMRKGALRALPADLAQPGVLNVLVCHARTDRALVRQVASTIATGAPDLVSANALYQGLPDLFEPLATQGAKALEFGGVGLHDGAIEAYRAASLMS